MTKGVILDTNAAVADATEYMVQNSRIAAFGGVKHSIKPIAIGDYVFLFAKGQGVIAAAQVTGDLADDGPDTCYMPVDFIIKPRIIAGKLVAVPAKQIKQLCGRNFFWAKTVKSPYLTLSESDLLLDTLINRCG